MSHISDTIRKHHQELLESVSTQVKALADNEPGANPAALSALLSKELGPHADGETKNFYPAMERLIKEHGQATATMQVDHQFIADYVGQIDALVEGLRSARPAERAALMEQVRRLALKLEALLELHFEKEERIYLPLFDAHLSPKEQQRIVDNLHEAFETD